MSALLKEPNFPNFPNFHRERKKLGRGKANFPNFPNFPKGTGISKAAKECPMNWKQIDPVGLLNELGVLAGEDDSL